MLCARCAAAARASSRQLLSRQLLEIESTQTGHHLVEPERPGDRWLGPGKATLPFTQTAGGSTGNRRQRRAAINGFRRMGSIATDQDRGTTNAFLKIRPGSLDGPGYGDKLPTSENLHPVGQDLS